MVESKPQSTADNAAQALDEVEIARLSLASLNPSDDSYLEKLDTLAHVLMARFSRLGHADDLNEGIDRTRQVLDIVPPGHPSHIGALSNMAMTLTKRFKFRGDVGDLTQAVDYLESAVVSCTPEQPYYLPLVANLSNVLLNRYTTYGDVADLDRIVDRSSFALEKCSAQNPNRDTLFNNWGTALKERFQKQGDRNDLDAALMRYQSCLDLRPPGHPKRHIALANLADAMSLKFEVDGHLKDLEIAANHFTSALQLLLPGQEGFLTGLMGLGIVFLRLFNNQGDTEKLQMAIGCYRTAIAYSTVPNLEHSRLLYNYAAALQLRYTLFGDINDIDHAIQYLTTSSEITPLTYSGRPNTLFTLAAALHDRYNATSNITDLDSSAEKVASALELCGPGYHDRPIMLSLYGLILSARFKARGDMRDLDLAASTCKDALALTSPGELNYSSTVANLSSALYDHLFYTSGNMDEIQSIIDYCDRALASTKRTDPAFITLKAIRAKTFFEWALYGREETAIYTSVDALREIITILPKGHVERVPVLVHLSRALQTRFQFSADTKDMDEAIDFYRLAHRDCKRGNTNYIHVCMHLGNALRESYDFDHGDVLDEAIVLLAEVGDILSFTPEHIDYKASLVNLAATLFARFGSQRNREDLDTAIDHLSRALTLPVSHQEFSPPFALATVLSTRYDEDGDLDDLERCVKLFAVAAEQTPSKHLDRGMLCRNYGSALFKLGSHRDQLKHVDAAIALYKEALEHLPPGHYDHPITYVHLAWAIHARAQLRSDNDELYEAINILRAVLKMLPNHNPMFQLVSHTAATLSMSMYTLSKSEAPSFMEDGFKYYENAAVYTHSHSFQSVTTALEWVDYADKQAHASALLAYQTSLDSLNQHLLSTASVKSRRDALLNKHWVKQTGTLATHATACAIARGELELAVELSEQGRGLLWSQMAQSRTPLDALRSASDEGRTLASDFERVSAQLARSAVAPSDTSLTASRLTMEERARRYHQLSKEFQDILARIRRLDGFETFLGRPSFQSLQHAALGGPVIIVNAGHRRCDAIIVLHDAPPRLVPLPDATLEDLTTLSADLYHMLKVTSHVGEEKMRERELVVFLRTLWDTIVRPIVDELTGFLPRGSRIWWCPTSILATLPLHAAGPYRQGAPSLPNLYISSYTPTLAALIRARHRPPLSPSESLQMPPTAFVAIGQAKPASDTAPELQTVDAELTLVRSRVPPSMPFSALSGDASTADAALAALRTHAWVHLACHGQPNAEQPFDSSFALRDRAVTVLDVVGGGGRSGSAPADGDDTEDVSASAARVHVPEFAFLSACHTTVGDRRAPDEVVHLAAAMQFAGFRSVVGTLWAVDDGMAQAMVGAFYTHLFASPGTGGSGGPGWDCTTAARALNKAAKTVDKAAVTIDQRIVFVHIGA